MAIRVLVISPRAVIRAALAALLRGQPKVQVVGDAAMPLPASYDCDLVLWDVGSQEAQSLPVRFLALLSDPSRARAWLETGAAGCVVDTVPVEELLSAIRQVAHGDIFLSRTVMREFIASTGPLEQVRAPVEPLTERELEVLRLLAQGLSNKDIAQKLYLSVRTVEGHLANVYGKLQLHSRTEAALWAMQKL